MRPGLHRSYVPQPCDRYKIPKPGYVFTDGDRTRYLLAKNASDCEIAVMEGVMGYYDGVGGITSRASAYDLASTTDTPVILIVNSRGMSVSLAAYVKGFLEYKRTVISAA